MLHLLVLHNSFPALHQLHKIALKAKAVVLRVGVLEEKAEGVKAKVKAVQKEVVHKQSPRHLQLVQCQKLLRHSLLH